MVDIRITRQAGSSVWLWTAALALRELLIWAAATFLGDSTERAEQRRIGADANFGGERAPVLPPQSAPFSSLVPLDRGDLGRLVRITGTAESRVAANAVWVRATDGRRILVRFEPAPPPGSLARVRSGGRIDLQGYLQNISQAEFRVWADTLRISLPQPPPAPRFGQLPDPEFLRLDSLYIRDFYISVRPEGLTPREQGARAEEPRR